LEYGQANLDKFNPLWEQQMAAIKKVFSNLPIGRKFDYQYDMDDQGIIYFLTGGDHKKSDSGITVTASGVGAGQVTDFINREKIRCWTLNVPFSWFCIDFGESKRVIPSWFTLGYGSSGSACCPRFWIVQGAKELPATPDVKFATSPHTDPSWKNLSMHTNDDSLKSDWAIHSWKLNTKEAFRYIRLVQTGPNCYTYNGTGEDAWSQVFVVNRFEVYGTLLEDNQKGDEGATTAVMQYGTGQTTNYKAPPLIKADPQVTRELHQLIIQLMRPDMDSKTEKVKVHDIIL